MKLPHPVAINHLATFCDCCNEKKYFISYLEYVNVECCKCAKYKVICYSCYVEEFGRILPQPTNYLCTICYTFSVECEEDISLMDLWD